MPFKELLGLFIGAAEEPREAAAGREFERSGARASGALRR
jgi:hypothetical protein